MKRSLKTIKKQFGSVTSQRHSAPSKGWFQQRIGSRIVITASALTAATLGLATGRPAEALQIFPVDLSGYAPNSLNEDILVTDTFGTSVPVNFSWTGDTGNFSVLAPSNQLTGGFVGGSILEIQHDPASENEAVNLTVDFGGPVEQARLIVIDVDRDNSNTWQDLIQVGGSAAPAAITPATTPSTLLQVSPEVAALVNGIPLGIEPGNANGGVVPGLAPATDYTVDIVGGAFTGVFNPRNLSGLLTGPATTTEFTPINDTATGGVPINPTASLPNPAAPPSAGIEAQNQSSEGTITVDYLGSVATPLSSLTFNYGNGPASPTAAINPAGGDGYITTNDANGGPGNHGVGLYTIFIVPGSIGTAKSASAPVQVSETEFDVTYTVSVENFGNSTTLSDVQVTDDLTQTFGGATGFTVVGAPTVISGPPTLQTGNPAFDGNGNQNLLDGTGTLAPGASAVIEYTVRLDTTAANINPGTTYNNTVVGAGTTPIGLRVTDNSVDDSTPPDPNTNPNPDPNGDGDPLEQSPTPVVLPPPTPLPSINVSEQFIDTTLNPADGVFPGNTARVRYRVRVQNTGPEQLSNVSLFNDFTSTFDDGTRGGSGPDNGFEVVSVTPVAGIVANGVNPTYNGGDTVDSGGFGGVPPNATLTTGGTLNPGEFTEYEILVDVDTTNNGSTLTTAIPGTFFNSTIATGVGTTSTRPVSDISNDGSTLGLEDALNPDGNSPTGGGTVGAPGDPAAPTPPPPGDPANENTPTPVTLQPNTGGTNPQINVSEIVTSTVIEPTGTYGDNTGRVTYRIRVQNTGDEDLTNVDLINDFTETFDNGTRGGSGPDNGFEIISLEQVDGVANAINPAYDGGDTSDEGTGPANTNNPSLITGGNLAVGEFSEYEVVVDVDLTDNGETLVGPLPGPFDNSTITNGVGVTSTIPVSDISNDATGIGLEAALNPAGNSPTGGSTAGAPGDPAAPAPPNPADPANENIPTPVNFPTPGADPLINVSEEVINTQLNPAGGAFGADTGRVTYRIRVQNTGPEDLRDVTLINDFTETFDDGTRGGSGPDNGFEIVEVRQVTGGGQTPNDFNAAYDGGDTDATSDVGPANTNDNVLITGGDLDVGQFSEYEIDVDVNLADNGETLTTAVPGPFINSTLATGIGDDPTTPSNIPVADRSNDRNSVDPVPPDLGGALNPDGGSPIGGANVGTVGVDPTTLDPGTADPDNTPTPVSFTVNPQINVSEEVVSTTLNPTGGAFGPNTGRVLYRIRVQNTGPEDLRDVSLINDFTDTFDNGTRGGSGPDNGFEIVTVRQITGGGQTPNDFNPAYDGGDSDDANDVGPANTDDNILVSGGDLDVGQFSEYEIEVDVDLTDSGETLIAPLPGPFLNSTLATGIGDDPVAPSNIPVNDRSNDRNSVDPVPPTLEGALNPDGGSPNGGGAVGTPGNPPPDPGTTDPENTPSPATFATQPQINVAEQVVTTVLEPTGTYGANTGRVTYRIRVQNTGVEDLNSVVLTNDFTDTFDNGTRGGSGPDNGFEIVDVRELTGGGQTPNALNPTYDGGDTVDNGTGPGNTNDATLITGGTLAVGQFSEYEIDVDVDLTNNGSTLTSELPGPFDNFTTATGIGNTSTIPVSDISNDLNSVTPTPDTLAGALNPQGGSPTGGGTIGTPGGAPLPPDPADPENTPSPANFVTTPEISVIERIDPAQTEVGPITGATYGTSNVRLVYQVVVRNIGIEDLQNVDLTNDFRPTFGTSGVGPTDDFTVVGSPTLVTAGGGVTTVPVNPNFDGSTDLLLAGDPTNPASILNVGEFAVYEIVVDVNTAGANVAAQLPGPFDNQTTTTGIGIISGETTADISNDINPFPNGGTTPDPVASDPNGNLEANEAGENTPTPAVLGADLRLVKRITRVTRGGTDLLIAGIDDFTNQPGTSDDDTLADLSGNSLPLGVFDVPNPLQSGDVVEYTVYFFNAGVAQAANIEMCDELQVPSVLQPNSIELASPTALSALGTNLTFAGGSPLTFPQAPLAPLVESCISFPGAFPSGTPAGGLGVGAGGGVVVGGPDLGLNVDASEVGAFRFTVVIP